jgi:hypothetical protein
LAGEVLLQGLLSYGYPESENSHPYFLPERYIALFSFLTPLAFAGAFEISLQKLRLDA